MDKSAKDPNAAPMTEIDLYDAQELARLIEAATGGVPSGMAENLSADEIKRAALLEEIRDAKAGPHRTLLFGSPEMLGRLDRLKRSAPNFSEITGLFRREAQASMQAMAPMTMPPLILLGPPGAGKTYFARGLAAALDTPHREIAANMEDDLGGSICGHSLSWRSPRLGLVARTLIDEKTAAVLLLVDEIEKTPKLNRDETPNDIWHSLFERENARRFSDMFLGLGLRADYIFWVCTANSLAGLPRSVIDRALVIFIPPTGPEERRALAAHVFAKFNADRSARCALAEGSLAILAEHSPRAQIKLLALALGYAAERGQRQIGSEDLAKAQRFVAPAAPKQKFGFI